MVDKKDFSVVSYMLGIISIVLAFFTPIAGLVFGIIGFIHSKKQKTELSLKAKKLCTIGIVVSAILAIVSIVLAILFTFQGLNGFPQIPTS